MGDYLTNAQVVGRLGTAVATQLTTDSGSTPDTALIDLVIAEVEGAINMALRSRTASTITLADYPQSFAMLRGFAMAMTVYRVATRRPPVAKDWSEANKTAEGWLAKLSSGEVDLPDAELNHPRLEYGSADQNAATMREL